MFENYKDCLFDREVVIKSQQRFKSDNHKVYAEEVIKIALSSGDDKRLQTLMVLKNIHTEQTHLKCANAK